MFSPLPFAVLVVPSLHTAPVLSQSEFVDEVPQDKVRKIKTTNNRVLWAYIYSVKVIFLNQTYYVCYFSIWIIVLL
jgi:hypothetical protein